MLKQNLTKKIKKGDEFSFEQLYKVYYSRMLSYCRLFISDEMVAEDLVQECFLKLWRQRKKLNTGKSLESLLFVMLRNKCLNHLRDQKKLDEKLDLYTSNQNEIQYLYHIDFLGHEEKSLESKLIESLKQCIDELPGMRKEVFVRCKINGEKQKVVASDLGISVKTVEKYIRQSKDELFVKLKDQYPVYAGILAFILTS